jgi:hypothetical protein
MITCWPITTFTVEPQLHIPSFINSMSHPEVVLLSVLIPLTSSNVLLIQYHASVIDYIEYPIYILHAITETTIKPTSTPLSIFYVRVIRNALYGVNRTKKCTSPPHPTDIFPPYLPFHTPHSTLHNFMCEAV